MRYQLKEYNGDVGVGSFFEDELVRPIFPIPVIGYKQDSSSNEPNVPQSVAHLICVPQVPQMWHKMWHNSIYILSTNQYMSMKIRPWRHPPLASSVSVSKSSRTVRGRRRGLEPRVFQEVIFH